MILYWTVFTEFNGAVNFRNDTYGWDPDFSRLINAGRITA
jgi:murein L,D-transpeptidase YcbB/YkuD